MSRRAWIGVVVAAIAIGFGLRFGLTFPWARTVEALDDADWLLLAAAAGVNLVSLAAKGAAWHLLLRRATPIRASTAQAATFIGAAVSCISVSVSGEAARAKVAGTRDGVSLGNAATSLVMTRVVEALGLIAFLSVVLVVTPPWQGARPVGLALAGVAVAVTLSYHVVPGHRWHPLLARMAPFDRGGLAAPAALASVGWLAQWLTYHWSIVATHAAIVPAVSLTALVAANIAGILRLTPGNIGVTQGSLILGMRAFEVPAAKALAAGLALQAVQMLPVLAIGIGLLGTQGLRQLVTRRAGAV